MAVTDRKIARDAKSAIERLVVPIITAISQADVLAFSFVPGHSFEIVQAQCYCRTEAGVVTSDVKIQTVSALNAVLAYNTATRVDGVLAAAQAARRGSATDAINVHFTSDGSGVLTNGFVVVSYRAVPLNGDVETE
jgi:hypothetical protein